MVDVEIDEEHAKYANRNLYKVIEEELGAFAMSLSGNIAEQIREIIAKEAQLDPSEIEVYTVSEYGEQVEELAKDSGVPDSYITYLDVASIIHDEILGGDLSWEAFKIDGRSCLVLWRELK